jgi:hypothetical protein
MINHTGDRRVHLSKDWSSVGKITRRGFALGAVLLMSASVTLSAKEAQPEPMPTPAPIVEAWAMLFQMMGGLKIFWPNRNPFALFAPRGLQHLTQSECPKLSERFRRELRSLPKLREMSS